MTLFNALTDTIIITLYLLVFNRVSCDQFIDCRSRQCKRSYIICVDNENCEIDCGFFSEACQSSIIICPMNGNCNVKCDTQEACDNTIIRGENSNILNIECNSHIQSCYYLNVYCPQNKGSKTCKISGFDDFFEMNVFTINGFIDIQFDIQISLPSTTIHCNSPTSTRKYDESCIVSPTFPHTKCINDNNNNLCNHIIPTLSPTNLPTKIATISPTKNPTNTPSSIPTISPSLNPTISPSLNPTIKPSNIPTKKPTINPTLNPTDKPSNIPSISPTLRVTTKPTEIATLIPTIFGQTKSATNLPTFFPTKSPMFLSTKSPSNDPTKSPSNHPIKLERKTPSKSPTFRPTKSPSNYVIKSATNYPTNYPTKLSTENPSMFPTLRPTLKQMVPYYDKLITTTKMMETFIINSKYNINNNNNNDNDIENDERKPIIINLTNLMYVLIGTVFMCCFVCGCCFLFNILSNRVESNKRKWSDISNDIKNGFIFTNNSKSLSDIYSARDNEEKKIKNERISTDDEIQRNRGNTENTNISSTTLNGTRCKMRSNPLFPDDDEDVLGSDYGSDIIDDIMMETNININISKNNNDDNIIINEGEEKEGDENHNNNNNGLNIKEIIDNMNIHNNINKIETDDDLFNIPSRHTEEDVYIINIMEKQYQLSKIEGIHNQIQAQQNKVNDDKFSMKLMNSVVDDKLLANNIINDIQRSQQRKQQ